MSLIKPASKVSLVFFVITAFTVTACGDGEPTDADITTAVRQEVARRPPKARWAGIISMCSSDVSKLKLGPLSKDKAKNGWLLIEAQIYCEVNLNNPASAANFIANGGMVVNNIVFSAKKDGQNTIIE